MTTKLRRGLMISTLCLASAFGAWAMAQTGGKAPPPPSAIAIVDVFKVYANLSEMKTMQDRLKQQASEYQKSVDALRAEHATVVKDLEHMGKEKSATPEYRSKAFRRGELEVHLKARFEGMQALVELSEGDDAQVLFKKVFETIARMGKEQGYDAILWDDRSIEVPTGSFGPLQVKKAIQDRRIMYASERIDITDQVITQMNNEFKAGKK